MNWSLFVGSWKLSNKEIESNVRSTVHEVLTRGDGIVTGGATGVDYYAMDEAMKLYPDASRLKVIIPAYLDDYINDYHTNWRIEPITGEIIDELESLLRKIKSINKDSLVEMPYTIITQDHYNERHDEEVKISDEVHAFQLNESPGTQDTIDKAVKAGLPISLHKKYSI